MRNKLFILIALSTLVTPLFAQDPRNSDMKVTADIQAGCYLTAENINFGVLAMPLVDQTAQSNMKIKCSKGANLSVNLSYNGASFSSSTFEAVYTNNIGYPTYRIKKNGQYISEGDDIQCASTDSHMSYADSFNISSQQAATLLNLEPYTWYQNSQFDTPICNFRTLNIDNFNSLVGGSTKGKLQGLSSSENIVYYISTPDNQIWNNYKLLSTGNEQTIPLTANIKRADNATHRLTPDTYQSNLNVVLDY